MKKKKLRDKKGRFKGSHKFECECCGTAYKLEELKQFKIDVKTCATTHATTIGWRMFLICQKCLKEKGMPDYEYMGVMFFKKPGAIRLWY